MASTIGYALCPHPRWMMTPNGHLRSIGLVTENMDRSSSGDIEGASATPRRYQRELARTLSVSGAVALTLVITAPAASVLVVGPVVLGAVGTGTVPVLAVAAVVTGCLALCWAELGSRYPTSGGVYGLVARTLGRWAGFVGLMLHLTAGVVVSSALALACGAALTSVGVVLSQRGLALGVLSVATVIAALRLRVATAVAIALLVLELGALLAVTIIGFARPQRRLSDVLAPHPLGDQAATLAPSAVLAGVALGILAYAGYGAAVVFSEELRGARRGVARAVLWTAGLTIVAVGGPILAALLAARELEDLRTRTPVAAVLGPITGDATIFVVTAVLVVAAFNSLVGTLMEIGRIVFSSARDNAWPAAVNAPLARVRGGSRVPTHATIAAGAAAAILTAISGLAGVVTFGSLVLVVTFGLVALGSLTDRRRGRAMTGYRMPWWPLPPLVALAGLSLAAATQRVRDLIIVAAIVGIATLYYVIYLQRRQNRWVLLAPVDFEG